jgi:F-type H+-transporting ATPase subunit b
MDNPLVRIEPGLLIWTIITFVALLVVLRWKAWGPIVAAIERREKTIKDALDSAKSTRDEAAKLLAEHKAMIDQARRETARMIEQGRKDAEQSRAELIEKARADAQEVLAQGRRQIERETKAAVQQIRGEAANLAVLAAGKIVKVSIDEGTQKRLIDDCLKEIGDLPASGSRPS